MAHVASDLKSQMLNRMLPQAAKRSYAADTKAATPFDSVLDETARPAPEPRQTRAADDNSPRADRPKPADRPANTAKSDDNSQTADAGTAADASPATTSSKTSDATTADKAASGDTDKAKADDAQQATDAKPTDAAAAVAIAVVIDPAIAAATAQVDAKAETKGDTAAAVAATAIAAKTAEPAATTAATEAGADAALAEPAADALAALAAKADKADKTAKKADDKPAVAAKATSKATSPLHPDAAVQAATAEPHKDSEAHASAEETANTHRGVATDKPVAPAPDATSTTAAPKAADLAPPPALTVPAAPHAAQAATAVAAPAAAQTNAADAAVPISGVAFEITSKIASGMNQFDIRLDPAELGRIHVRMDVDRDGNVVTHMMADRHDTLDMLRKDTAGLERALQDAGLKTSDSSLQFSLRDQSANQQQSNNSGSNTANIIVEDDMPVAEPLQRNYAAYRGQTGGLDIRV